MAGTPKQVKPPQPNPIPPIAVVQNVVPNKPIGPVIKNGK